MSYPRFAFYNVIGGVLWVCSLSGIGYLIGDQPWVKAHFSLVALALIVIPATPALWVLLRHLLQQRRQRRRKV